MRHKKSYKKLGRVSDHRNSFIRNMTRALIDHGQVKTTVVRAKVIKPVVEKVITQGKKCTLASNRRIAGFFWGCREVTMKVQEWANLFSSRKGGYTRLVKLGARKGDGAEMCRIEFVDNLPRDEKPLAKNQVTPSVQKD